MTNLKSLKFTEVIGESIALKSTKDKMKQVKVVLNEVLWKVLMVKINRNFEFCEYSNLWQTKKHSWTAKICSQVEKLR